MKTAVTILQEMMVKLGQIPEYECIAQTGPQHQATFDYRCHACGVTVTAAARSKKEAKQEVARLMLQELSRRGHGAPPASPGAAPPPVDARSYVALLKELCAEYRLAGVAYELVGDTGPPHLRHFTVRARVGRHERVATCTSKKAARQLAAQQLYSYLRENLARVTGDFNEEDALVRAHEKAMDRYSSPGDEPPRRPDLGQMVAEYHVGLTARMDGEVCALAHVVLGQLVAEYHVELTARMDGEVCALAHVVLGQLVAEYHVELTARMDGEARALAQAALQRSLALAPAAALGELAEALRLRLQVASLPCGAAPPLYVLQLLGAAPELAFSGEDEAEATDAALRYVRRALRTAPPTPPAPDVTMS